MITITLHPNQPGPKINRNIYGHFAEHLGRGIYEGIWVGEDSPIPNTRGMRNDVLEALHALDIPVLRWPGGCFADEYHWKDGVGPRENRPSIINTHWGGVVENNHFGTHEFMDLCELLNTDAYICGNVGSGTVQEMMEWVEYLTSPADSPMANWRRRNGREEPWRVPYFGVGNESWGCGGHMRPEYYADEYRRFQTFVKNYGPEKIYRIACGANTTDYRWTEVMMEQAGRFMDGLSLHYYTVLNGQWPPSGSAIDFGEEEWFSTMKQALAIDGIIAKHAEVMDGFDPGKRIGMIVDEWGTWHASEPGTNPGFLYQQNSLRDALVAAVHFHIFHRHADRVMMANIAQTVNVLQAMILTDGEKMLRTPTYWVFEMFKVHHGAVSVPVVASIPWISASASLRARHMDISLANLDPNSSRQITVDLGLTPVSAEARILEGERMQAHNTFAEPDAVIPRQFDGWRTDGAELSIDLPARSVVVVSLALA